MANKTLTPVAPAGLPLHPERELTLAYAPARARASLAALWALDDTLAQLLRTTRDPIVGQMRLTWWHEALTRLDNAPPPAEPVLQALARDLLPRGVPGAALTSLVEGWEELLEPAPLADEGMLRYARGRGALFAFAGTILGASDPTQLAGEGWALVDLAWHSSDAAVCVRARDLARPRLAEALAPRWSRQGRAMGALAHLAWRDCAADPAAPRVEGSPGRVLRVLRHRLTGR